MSEPRYDDVFFNGMKALDDLQRCDSYSPCYSCDRCNNLVEYLGIVGHAKEKFTPKTETRAKAIIDEVICQYKPRVLVSGRSPMGGVDIWTEEAAVRHGKAMDACVPRQKSWEGEYGFKARNLDIARKSGLVVCIVVADFPPGFKGKAFPFCYHCKDRIPTHVKSGGCWTAWKAKRAIWKIIV